MNEAVMQTEAGPSPIIQKLQPSSPLARARKLKVRGFWFQHRILWYCTVMDSDSDAAKSGDGEVGKAAVFRTKGIILSIHLAIIMITGCFLESNDFNYQAQMRD